MPKPNYRSDRDSLYGDILRKKNGADTSQYSLPGHGQGQIKNPESKWALTGRGCPKDSGQLYYFEANEDTGVQWYYCKDCGTRYTENELNSDELYRIIPRDVVNRYIADMERKGK